MSSEIPIRIDDISGDVVLFEVEGAAAHGGGVPGLAKVSREPKPKLQAISSITEMAQKLKPVVKAFYDSLTSEDKRPDKIEVEFGVKLNAESGLVIAKASTEGSIKLKLTWGKD